MVNRLILFSASYGDSLYFAIAGIQSRFAFFSRFVCAALVARKTQDETAAHGFQPPGLASMPHDKWLHGNNSYLLSERKGGKQFVRVVQISLFSR